MEGINAGDNSTWAASFMPSAVYPINPFVY
jgi:hypothetical protein